MKRGTIALLASLSMAALVAGGCASNETVKKEEPVASTVKAEPVKAEPVKTEPVKVEPKEDSAAKASAAMVLETVYFDFDKSDLRKDARDVLYKNAELLLKTDQTAKIRIEGNCDERGSAEYNLALGERRAKAAQKYLQTLGVAADRISIISYGKEKPAVDGHDEAAWSKNRRGDFVIIK
ncbi:MAG TPA: peptidoglycan-associated lipoprotein Pal [Deltaproteobacteria bacterium]|nr:peptidoglycan-associated lipoprotein Pal [Deltaproteobacteria bacterium]HQB38166.1 peptidoglycan-associated lipoprotein Pal [Deltaproteobacteria bacterium]